MSETMRWTLVDGVVGASRPWLGPDDLCYYYLMRDSRGYGEGPRAAANSLIINFKRDPTLYKPYSGPMYYKGQAVRTLAGYVADFFRCEEAALGGAPVFLVPIPTSKPRRSASHDPRMDDLCRQVEGALGWVKFVPLLDTIKDIGKAHAGTAQREPAVIASNISCGELPVCDGNPVVVLIDDVLTTGAHYAACRSIVRSAYPEAMVLGLFLSAHVRDSPSWGILGH